MSSPFAHPASAAVLYPFPPRRIGGSAPARTCLPLRIFLLLPPLTRARSACAGWWVVVRRVRRRMPPPHHARAHTLHALLHQQRAHTCTAERSSSSPYSNRVEGGALPKKIGSRPQGGGGGSSSTGGRSDGASQALRGPLNRLLRAAAAQSGRPAWYSVSQNPQATWLTSDLSSMLSAMP